jgi:hypothetical protein
VRVAAILVSLIAAGAVAAVLLAPGTRREEPRFVDPATGILRRLVPETGQTGLADVAAAVYDEGSFTLRESVPRDKFIAMIDRVNQTLGAFKRVVKVLREDQVTSIGGDVVRVDLEVEFARARTTSSISFHRREPTDRWLLLGVRIDIPPDLLSQAEELAAKEAAHLAAPVELEGRVRELLTRIADGKAGAVYEQAAPSFQHKIPRKSFNRLLDDQNQVLGKFVRVIRFTSSEQDVDQSRARLYGLLEYEKQRTTGTFEFVREVEGSGKRRRVGWKLLSYQVLVPEPRPM